MDKPDDEDQEWLDARQEGPVELAQLLIAKLLARWRQVDFESQTWATAAHAPIPVDERLDVRLRDNQLILANDAEKRRRLIESEYAFLQRQSQSLRRLAIAQLRTLDGSFGEKWALKECLAGADLDEAQYRELATVAARGGPWHN